MAVLLAAALAACSGTPAARPVAKAAAEGSAPSSAAPTPIPLMPTTKVLTVVLENHDRQSALEAMPLLKALSSAHGTATAYGNLAHPSLPNYLALAGGSTFGVTDDAGPSSHPQRGTSVFDLGDAKLYAETMTQPCQTSDEGSYRVKHNPWLYFPDGQQACAERDVPLSRLASDVATGTLPTVGLVVPNQCHDGHDCPLGEVDPWLHDLLAPVLAGPDYLSGRLAVVITFDEVDSGPGVVLTTVVAPRLTGSTVDVPLNHLAWNRWMTDLLGAPPMRDAAGAPSLGAAFGLA